MPHSPKPPPARLVSSSLFASTPSTESPSSSLASSRSSSPACEVLAPCVADGLVIHTPLARREQRMQTPLQRRLVHAGVQKSSSASGDDCGDVCPTASSRRSVKDSCVPCRSQRAPPTLTAMPSSPSAVKRNASRCRSKRLSGEAVNWTNRISQMRPGEMATVVLQVAEFVRCNGDDPTKEVSQALSRRISELLSRLSLNHFGDAANALGLLRQHNESGTLCIDETSLLRVLRARLEYFIYHPPNADAEGGPIAHLEHLLACRASALQLMAAELIPQRVLDISVKPVVRWIKRLPFEDFATHGRTLGLAASEDAAILTAVMHRIHGMSLQGLSASQLRAHVSGLITLHEELHRPMFAPELEQMLCDDVAKLMTTWSPDRLLSELQPDSGWFMLRKSSSSGRLGEVGRTTISARLVQWICDVADTFRHVDELHRMQADVLLWIKVVRFASGEDVAPFDEVARRAVVSALSSCYYRCLASQELEEAAAAIDKMHMQVIITMAKPKHGGSLPELLRNDGGAQSEGPQLSSKPCLYLETGRPWDLLRPLLRDIDTAAISSM